MLRTVMLVVAALIVGAALACGAMFALGILTFGVTKEGSSPSKAPVQKNEPPAEKTTGPSSAVIRVSGTQGVAFRGSYGSIEAGQRSVEGTLGEQPTDYEMALKPEGFERVYANFSKPFNSSAAGTLRAQILINGDVVKEQQTEAKGGSISVDYTPRES